MLETNLKLRQTGDNSWVFEYPDGVKRFNDMLNDGIEWMEVGEYGEAEKVFRSVIKDSGEHIDAIHHLAMILEQKPGMEEKTFRLWARAVDIGLASFPEEFKMGIDRLEWCMFENRPFLRAYHALGLEHVYRGYTDRALIIFNNLLSMNPSDNQGVRTLAIDCDFALNRPEDVLRICDNFPNDATPDTLYGRPLALLMLDKRGEAERALMEAVGQMPLAAKELVKEKHRKPKGMSDDYLTVGGPDEAYDYYLRMGKHWKKTEGALELVRRCLWQGGGAD